MRNAYDTRHRSHANHRRAVPPTQGFITKEECQDLLARCSALATGGGDIHLSIRSMWRSGIDWARNRAHLTYDSHETTVSILRTVRGATASVTTMRVDDSGLREAMQFAEHSLQYDFVSVTSDDRPSREVATSTLTPTLWSDATYGFDGAKRGAIVRQLIEPAESAGLLSAGELRVKATSNSVINTSGLFRYYPTTRVEFSTTVRDTKGTASGWAGVDDFDVTRVDMTALAHRAIDKCTASRSPSAIEPGRYTAILEPQAVADLFGSLSTPGRSALDRLAAERMRGPFAARDGVSKIGQRVLDPRLMWSADPMDPVGGFLPFHARTGVPRSSVKWVDQGILRQLAYPKGYALARLGRDMPQQDPFSWRLSGGGTSIDEMIASTARGVLVTRLHGVNLVDEPSWTCTGYTRDGLWLIENGKITKPIKNFRFVESPLFILNKVDQLGPPQRVYSGESWENDRACVAPPVKVLDFNFTQLADAV